MNKICKCQRASCTGCWMNSPEFIVQDLRVGPERAKKRQHDFSPVDLKRLKSEGAMESKPSNNNSNNEGTVINNYYANSYYGSIDASGQGFGKPSSTAHQLLGGVGSLMGNLLKDQETEETTNLSDRVYTEKVGNTAINTQSFVGRLLGYAKRHTGRAIMSASDEPAVASPSTQRFFSIRLAQWTASQGPYDYITFTPTRRLLQGAGVFSTMLQNHTLFKSGWRVQVQVNASQFHSGALLVFFAPEFLKAQISDEEITHEWDDLINWQNPHLNAWDKVDSKINLFSQTPEQWTLYPHQILNLRTNSTVSLEVPYVNCTPGEYCDNHSSWTLVICVLSKLTFPSGSSSALDVNLSIAPVKPVWHGVHHPPMVGQAPIPVRVRENFSQFLTTIPDKTDPCYGNVAGPKHFLPAEIKNFVEIAQMPSFLSITTGSVEGPTFSVGSYSENPCLQFNVIITDKHLFRTSLCAASLNFVNYRGSLVLNFTFVGSAMCFGKFLCAYTPPGAGKPSSIEEAMLGTYAIWDVGLNSTFRMVIPYVSLSEFRLCYSKVTSPLDAAGWFSVFQYTQLTFPAGVPNSANVLVTACGGTDFELRLPYTPMVNEDTGNAETGLPDIPSPGTDFLSSDVAQYSTFASSLQHFYDRSLYFGVLGVTSRLASTARKRVLTPFFVKDDDITIGREKLTQFCYPFVASTCFSYWRSDLEITVVPNGLKTGETYSIVWVPVAGHDSSEGRSYLGEEKINKILMTNTPVATAVSPNPVSFMIPYTSPLSHLPVTFDGHGSYDIAKSRYGVAPAAHFGTLFCFVNSQVNGTVSLFLRFKNFHAYCPRPFFMVMRNWKTDDHRGRLRLNGNTISLKSQGWIRDLILDGDVESNPGPADTLMQAAMKDLMSGECFKPEEKKVFQTLLSKLKSVNGKSKNMAPTAKAKVDEDMAAFQRFLESDDPIETLVNGWDTVRQMQEIYKGVKEKFSSNSFWYQLFLKFAKFLVMVMTWAANPTPSVTLGMMAIATLDALSTSSLVNFVKSFLEPKLGAPPCEPKCPKNNKLFGSLRKLFNCGGKLQDESWDSVTKANHGFNLLKNLDWVVKLIVSIVDWIRSWFEKKELTDQCKLAEMMEQFGEKAAEISNYRCGNLCDEPKEAFKWMKELFDLATKTQKTNIAVLAQKYLSNKSNDKARMEPIVVVLRGKPGAGKSIASQLLAQAVSKMNAGFQSVYSFPPDSDHLDGYSGQYAVIMDDLGQNPDGKDFATFCQMVSTTNFIPSMAHLSEKGRPFRSNFIVATTNLAEFRPVTIADPGAVDRRITFDLTVTPGSACTIQGKLDLAKAITPDGPALGPFKQQCEILHKTGLKFTCNRNRKLEMSLLELIDAINEEINRKTKVLTSFTSLVFQGPMNGCVVPEREADMIEMINLEPEFKGKLIDEIKMVKQEVVSLRQLQQEFYKFSLFISLASSALWIGYKIYDWYAGKKDDSEELIEKVVEKPEPNVKPEVKAKFLEPGEPQAAYEGIVKKQKVQKLRLEGPKHTKQESQGPAQANQDFERFVATHVVSTFSVHIKDKIYSQSCILVSERALLVNTHTWQQEFQCFEVRGFKYTKEQCEFVDLVVDDIYTDMTMVKLPPGQKFKNNVSKFMSKKDPFPQRTTSVIGISANGPLFYSGKILRSPATLEIQRGLTSNMFLYQASTANGYCGSAVVGVSGGRKCILGVHSAGASGIAGGVWITQEHLRQALRYFDFSASLESQGKLTVVGNGPTVHVVRKTKLKPSVAFPIFKPDAGPAVLSGKDKRLDEGIDFDKGLFSKHTGDLKKLPHEFRVAAEWYANEIFNLLGKDNSPLSVHDAIVGYEWLDGMDPKTSPGLPFSMQSVSRTDLIDFETGTVISRELAQIYNKFVDGDYSDHCFQTFLKDEIRSNAKIKVGKTRIVDVPNLAHVLLGRVLLGRFCSKMHANPGTETGSAIGCNPDVDWTKFAQELIQKRYVYDVDYSNFDATHSSAMFDLVKEVFFSPKNGFSPDLGPYLDSLKTSTHAWLDERYLIEGGLPSGCSATSILNTVMNNIIIRALLLLTYKNFECDDILVLSYGDDLLVASDYQIDFNRVKRVAEEHTNYVLTTANKAPTFPLESSLLDVQFLKRRFVPFDVLNFVFRPVMATDNLKTMLSFYQPGSQAAKLISVAQLAFHSGYDIYEMLFSPFREAGFKVPSWWILEDSWQQGFY